MRLPRSLMFRLAASIQAKGPSRMVENERNMCCPARRSSQAAQVTASLGAGRQGLLWPMRPMVTQ